MDTSELIQILTINKGEQFIIDVLKSVNKQKLTDLEKIILRDLLKIYSKIYDNAVIKAGLDKIIKEINDEKIRLEQFDNPPKSAIIMEKIANLGKTGFNIVPILTRYIHYTYQVFNIVIDNARFKDRIKEQLFGEDRDKETLEIQQKRFELYKEIYESGLITDEKLKIKFKETIEELFGKTF